jgi:hypothetical protein
MKEHREEGEEECQARRGWQDGREEGKEGRI